jgi:predicted dehydrogenase
MSSIHQKIHIGIVGAGQNTCQKHIPNLLKIDGVEIVGLCNRSRESSERVAKQFGIKRIFADWKELVDCGDVDAVVIGTWPYMHSEISIAALKRGKHVLCEARMASNALQAKQMFDVYREKPHLTAQIVPSPMTLEFDATIIDYVKGDMLGHILAVNLVAQNQFIDFDAPMHWRHDYDLCGVNTMSVGIWYEAFMRWVGQATKVLANAKTFVKQREDFDGNTHNILIPDHIDILADMQFGGLMNMQFSAVTGHSGGPCCTIFGSRGTLQLKDDCLYFAGKKDKEFSHVQIAAEKKGFWRVEEEFINSIRGLETVKLTDFETGVRYMEFTEAAITSAKSGKAVLLESLV